MSTPAAIRAWESHFTLYRTIWRSNVLASFLQPLLYLLGMGLGVGALVDAGTRSTETLGGLGYFEFMAPGLLATSAMMVASNEAMWPVMGGFKWFRGFHAAASAPLSPGDVAAGVGLWQLTKAAIAAGGVALALVAFDDTRSFGLIPAVACSALTGLAFAAPITAWSATREDEHSFPTINRLVVMPLFLFGGAFYPISELPAWLHWIAKATPLWHGVELARASINERLDSSAFGHLAVLAAYVVVGGWWSQRAFRDRLTR